MLKMQRDIQEFERTNQDLIKGVVEHDVPQLVYPTSPRRQILTRQYDQIDTNQMMQQPFAFNAQFENRDVYNPLLTQSMPPITQSQLNNYSAVPQNLNSSR